MTQENRQQVEKSVKGSMFAGSVAGFMVGNITKDIVEDEMRVAFKQERGPAVSIRELFKKETWKEIGKVSKEKAFWKTYAKELGITFGAIIPGAVAGYLMMRPVYNMLVCRALDADEYDKAFKDAAARAEAVPTPQAPAQSSPHTVTNAENQGKLQAAPEKSLTV